MSVEAPAIDRLLEAAAQAREVPGVVAVAADRDGVVYEGAFGRLSVDGEAPVQLDTLFRIASMTKPVTSVAVLQLVERGQLELEQPVASVLPEFGELQVLEGFEDDAPRLRPPRTPVTIRHLLTHTSGLSYFFSNPDIDRYHQVTGTPTVFDFDRGFLHTPLVADPGERWEYGISTDWLGEVVAAVSGQRLGEYFTEHVFGPLGMVDSGFTPGAQQRERAMAIHARTSDGGLAVTDLDWPQAPQFLSGGGGLFSTARDYLRFLRALLNDGELDGARILEAETVEAALSNQIGDIEPPTEIRSAHPELANDISFFPELRQRWGLGFHLLLDDLEGGRRAGSGDWAGITNCYFWIDRAAGLTAAFFTQVLPFFDERIVERTIVFEQALYGGGEAVPGPAAASQTTPA